MIHHYFLRKHYAFLAFFVVVVNYTVLPCEKNITPLSFAIRTDNRMSHMITLQASLPLLRPFRLSLRQPHSSRPLENLLVKSRFNITFFSQALMINLSSQTYFLFLFVHLSVVFILMKQGSGWS